MSSGWPEDADNRKREQRQGRIRIIVGLFLLMLGIPPLLNALGNPRIQALHAPDVLQLIAAGLALGFGLGLLLSPTSTALANQNGRFLIRIMSWQFPRCGYFVRDFRFYGSATTVTGTGRFCVTPLWT